MHEYWFLNKYLAAGGLYVSPRPVCLFLSSLKSGVEPVQRIIQSIILAHDHVGMFIAEVFQQV